jgi:V/A-type H+-transporting ATPase subunit C
MSGYEYGNTRLRAMRSRLLSRSDYLDLAAAESLDGLLAALADTSYASAVEAALVRYRGIARLDRAVGSHLADTLRRMASFYEGKAREMVDLLVYRWDLRNLQALIRLSDRSLTPLDPTGLLVPAGRLDETDLSELASQPNTQSLVDLAVAWGIPSSEAGIDLLRARAAFLAEGDISALEIAVDRVFAQHFEKTVGSGAGVATKILRAEVDARNLEIALRRRAARMAGEPGWDADSQYLSGGTVPPEVWVGVADTDPVEAIAEVVSSRAPIPEWKPGLRAWASGGELTDLSDGLRRAITTAAAARFVNGDPLGFDIPVAFTFSKEAEARNIILIGRGLAHQLPVTMLEDRLEVA